MYTTEYHSALMSELSTHTYDEAEFQQHHAKRNSLKRLLTV